MTHEINRVGERLIRFYSIDVFTFFEGFFSYIRGFSLRSRSPLLDRGEYEVEAYTRYNRVGKSRLNGIKYIQDRRVYRFPSNIFGYNTDIYMLGRKPSVGSQST